MSYLDSYQNWDTPPADDRFKTQAACRHADPSIFFPDGPGGHANTRRKAHEYCANCPVTAECLDYVLTAVHNHHDRGIWAGTHANQRRELRAERNRGAA